MLRHVDSSMAASQNGFCSFKLSIHKKTNIMQIVTKNIALFINLIFYHREIVKLDHFMTLSLSYSNTVLWCRRCKIYRFVAAPYFDLLLLNYHFRNSFSSVHCSSLNVLCPFSFSSTAFTIKHLFSRPLILTFSIRQLPLMNRVLLSTFFIPFFFRENWRVKVGRGAVT